MWRYQWWGDCVTHRVGCTDECGPRSYTEQGSLGIKAFIFSLCTAFVIVKIIQIVKIVFLFSREH
jgi:hypothetical protein